MRNLLAFWILSFSMFSCIKWELDRREITNFNIEIIGSERIGFEYKNDFLQKETEEYLFAGKTIDTSMLLSKVSDDGILINEIKNIGTGEGHRLIPGPDDHNFLLADSEQNAFLIELDNTEEIVRVDSLRKFADQSIGLIKEVRLLDFCITQDGSFWMTGFLQQEIGEKRLLLLRLDAERNLSFIKTFGPNQIGFSILEFSELNISLLSDKAGAKYLTMVDQEGIVQWEKKISSSIENTSFNILALGDSLITTSLNEDNQLFIRGFSKEGLQALNLRINDSGALTTKYLMINRFGHFVLLATALDTNSDPGVYLLEADHEGNILWKKRFEPATSGEALPLKVEQVKDYGYCIFGITNNLSSEHHYFLIKTDEAGELRN